MTPGADKIVRAMPAPTTKEPSMKTAPSWDFLALDICSFHICGHGIVKMITITAWEIMLVSLRLCPRASLVRCGTVNWLTVGEDVGKYYTPENLGYAETLSRTSGN